MQIAIDFIGRDRVETHKASFSKMDLFLKSLLKGIASLMGEQIHFKESIEEIESEELSDGKKQITRQAMESALDRIAASSRGASGNEKRRSNCSS